MILKIVMACGIISFIFGLIGFYFYLNFPENGVMLGIVTYVVDMVVMAIAVKRIAAKGRKDTSPT